MGVRELTSGYKISYDKNGITAQRIFLEGSEVTDDGSSIPVIGNKFADNTPAGITAQGLDYLYCTKIDQNYYGDDARCLMVTVYYTNEPIDNSNMQVGDTPPTDIQDLPQEFNYSGEFQLWKVDPTKLSSSTWVWYDNQSEKIAEAIPFKIRTYSMTLQKIVKGEDYEDFVNNLRAYIGKVNSGLWQGGGNACWLFTGAKSELFRDQQDKRAYRFDMTFSYRDPDDTNEDGWLKILSETGTWRMPYNGGYLYEAGDFDNLV